MAGLGIKDEPYNLFTVKDFAQSFDAYHIGQNHREELGNPFD